ncbi:unnamed protein product, partial [Urochloa humidicola]
LLPISTIPALTPRLPPASSLAPVPVTVAAATGAVPALVVDAAPAPAPVVGAGAGAIPIVFAAATHREAIREEVRRKKAQWLIR